MRPISKVSSVAYHAPPTLARRREHDVGRGDGRHGWRVRRQSRTAHPADVGSHSFEQEFTLNLLASDGNRLERIAVALEKDRQWFVRCLR